MNDVIRSIFDTGKIVDDTGRATAIVPTGISKRDGEALYNCIFANKATRTIETGFAYGISTLFICQALRDLGSGHHIAIDPFEDVGYGNLGLLNIRRAGFEDIFTFRKEYSQDILCEYLKRGDRFDFAFLDGHHTFDQVVLEFYYFEKIMDAGAHIMLHDLSLPSVRKAVTYIVRNFNWVIAMDGYSSPLSIAGNAFAYGRLMRSAWNEPYTWFLAPYLFQNNFVILRKHAPETSGYDHYVPF